MPRSKKEMERGLLNKGFIAKEGDHTFYFYRTLNGQKTRVFTKISHGGKDISDDLLSMMARQCKLSRKQFLELADCPMQRDAYEALLRSNRFV